MSQPASKPIILFKSPSPQNPCNTTLPDPYSHLFKKAGYNPYFLPVLSERWMNEDRLRTVIRHGPDGTGDQQERDNNGPQDRQVEGDGWSGVVATSARAGAAWINAVESIIAAHSENVRSGSSSHYENKQDGETGPSASSSSTSSTYTSSVAPTPLTNRSESSRAEASSWSNIPLFTPGPSTTSSFIIPPHLSSHTEYFPKPFEGADATGSGGKLAEFIVQRRREWENLDDGDGDEEEDGEDAGRPRGKEVRVGAGGGEGNGKGRGRGKGKGKGKLLILTGDKNLPDLTSILSSHSIEYQELEAYSTSPRPSLSNDLTKLLSSLLSAQEEDANQQDPNDSPPPPIWLAFFSPSTARIILSILLSPSSPLGIDRLDPPPYSPFKLAAIGQTTKRFLEEDEGWVVSGTAQEPTAKGLKEAVVRSDTGT